MNSSKQNLLDIVEDQKKTIEKYSNKLRDVVAAHKSLLIEKKALEDTIKILNDTKNFEGRSDISAASDNDDKDSKKDGNSSLEESEEEAKSQVTSLLTSISNLVAEKSHMEECFKVNQKQLLDDKKEIENQCKKLQEEVKSLTKQLKSLESKNQYDFFSRKDSKRHSKESSTNLKSKNETDESLSVKIKNYEKEVRNLRSELEAKNMIQEISEKKLKDYSSELATLQEEVKNLQIEHQSALQVEKEKARDVEDRAKELTAKQEKRVLSLETRLAELSETIGTYDRLRLQDQNEIQKLKDHISQLDLCQKEIPNEPNPSDSMPEDYDSIVKKIEKLKKKLERIAVKMGREEDFHNLFPDSFITDTSHSLCKEEYNKLKAEYELLKTKLKLTTSEQKTEKEVVGLQNQIKCLQEKVRVLSDKNKNIEKDYQSQIEQLKKTMKNEKARFKEALEVSGLDFRGRVWLLEEQLQKQRERSLAMLEEKEQEIQSLQSTFQMFLPGYVPKSEEEAGEISSTLAKQFQEGPHMIHYANELARRDIEITSLRKKKHQTEMALRDLQKEIISVKEEHKEEIETLKNEISRLNRCQTREGANLEYLKNVVYNFLLSSDLKSKRHMCNAIAAVLKFSDSELQTVIDHSKNKWWAKPGYKG